MLRFTRAFRPKAVMMENVPGLAEHRSFKNLCRDLRRLGYVVDWDVKDARFYGVPQRRKRLILVAGYRFAIPLARESGASRTVRDAIGDLRKSGESRDPLHNLSEHRSKKVRKLIRAIPKDGGSRSDLPKSQHLDCHKRTDGFSDVYGRMAWNEPAPTITGGAPIHPKVGFCTRPKTAPSPYAKLQFYKHSLVVTTFQSMLAKKPSH
jgi:DNA (cytosine-5)-methyltransferase 1